MINMIFILNRDSAPITTPILLGIYAFYILSCVRSLRGVFSSSPLVLLNPIVYFSKSCLVKLPSIISILFSVFPVGFFVVFVMLSPIVFNPSVMLLQQVFSVFLIVNLAALFTPRLNSARRVSEPIKITNVFNFLTLAALFSFHYTSVFLVCFNDTIL